MSVKHSVVVVSLIDELLGEYDQVMCKPETDTKLKISATMKSYWSDPANRLKRREAARLRRLEQRKQATAAVRAS